VNTARQKLVAARTALVLDQPFFGALALQLSLREDPGGCETAWVNGQSLGYDPKFIDGLTHAETVALVAHEVMHCAAGHPWRRDAREPERWNEAADYAINQILADSGFSLPKDALLDPGYAGKSAEWIYDRLPAPPPKGQGGETGESHGAPGPLGEVRDAPSESETTEADWQQAVQQAAAAAKARGALPGQLDRFAKESKEARVDWRSILRRFIQETASADYSWTRPNRRYVSHGLYLPALYSEEMGPIAVAIDTSGSIDQVLLEQFRAEVQAVVDEMRPRRTHVLFCDATLQRHDVFERDDVIEFNPAGGGGTDFRPVFEELRALEEAPACVVYLTDLDGTFPEVAPEVQVLWASTGSDSAPFGEVVAVNS